MVMAAEMAATTSAEAASLFMASAAVIAARTSPGTSSVIVSSPDGVVSIVPELSVPIEPSRPTSSFTEEPVVIKF